MDLLVGTVALRPYVFAFLAVFVAAGFVDLGWRRTLGFTACVWPVALAAELSSTRTGFPFGLYQYTGLTRGQELFIADVPFIDSLSFVFLAYAAYCLARAARGAALGDADRGRCAHDGARRRHRSARGEGRALVPRAALHLRTTGRVLRRAAVELRGVGRRGGGGDRPVPDPGRPPLGTTDLAGSRVILRRAWIQPHHDGSDR